MGETIYRNQEDAFQALWDRADAAGRAAAEAKVPTPMVVYQTENPFDDSSRVTKVYEPVMDGVCGFAWIVFGDGRKSFPRWATKTGKARKGYEGTTYWVSGYGQSMERKEAYARAFAEVLREAGITAYAQSRLD